MKILLGWLIKLKYSEIIGGDGEQNFVLITMSWRGNFRRLF
jgi:hypothetical protein